jgi:cell division protein FtsQ
VLPLQSVTLTRAPANVSAAQIEDAARRAVTGSFLTTDIERARTVFESLPWVRHATVRRVWPGSLEIDIEEHVAVARWWVPPNVPARMVNAQGELFVAEHEAALPLFIGPDEDSASMLARHLEWSDLLAPMERQINKLVLTRRQAWQLQLDDGTRSRGGEVADRRTARALRQYPAGNPAPRRAESDLRRSALPERLRNTNEQH